MDNQMQTDGQNVNGQGNSSPPEWFQTFAQQMVAHMTHMTQRMDTIEQRAQGQPPSPVDQATPLSTPITADTSTNTPTPANAPAPEDPAKRPRPKLRDMPLFTGKRSEWRSWKSRMEAKLRKDKLAIGDPSDHFAYIEASLDDTPAKMVLAYVERARKMNDEDPDQFMAYLNNIYGDDNAKERANNKLNSMSQGKEAFATFLPKFERTLAEAGGGEWTDEVKINTLKRMLNQELRRSLVYIPIHPEKYNDFIRTMQTLASRLAALDPQKPTTTTAPKSAPAADEMDWQPSTNKAQASEQLSVNKVPVKEQGEQKRAQWVSKDTLEKRKSNNLCLRCGGKGHFIGKCKLLPPRSPQQGQTKVKVTDAKNDVKDDETTVIEELDSDTESGKE
jgi:hypothetical protein